MQAAIIQDSTILDKPQLTFPRMSRFEKPVYAGFYKFKGGDFVSAQALLPFFSVVLRCSDMGLGIQSEISIFLG